jgi:hypothetical protein
MVVKFTANNQTIASTDAKGDPLAIPGDPNTEVVIDTGKIIQGESHG